MAATFALAFAQLEESRLDRAVFSARGISRAPEDHALGEVINRLEPDWQRRLSKRLAKHSRVTFLDAEDAIQEELVFLIENRRDVFVLESDRWLGLLFVRGRYRLLKNRSAPRQASTNAIEDALGEAALAQAELCVPASLPAEEEALRIPLPMQGGKWSRLQVISALQRFHRYHGRPPRARECRAVKRLPSTATISRHFGGLEKALLASGIRPDEQGRRRRPWPAVEVSRTCRSFYRRLGYWPNASDRARHPELPSRSVMLKCFGSTHGGEIRGVAEAILSAEPQD